MAKVKLTPTTILAFANLLSVDEGKSKGSAFRLTNKKKNYLVTAKHVLYDKRGDLLGSRAVICAYDPTELETGPLMLSIDLNEAHIKTHDIGDLCIVEIGDEIDFDDPEKVQTVPHSYIDVIERGSNNTFPVQVRSLLAFD